MKTFWLGGPERRPTIAGMYLRRCYRKKDGKRHAYWAMVESYRTATGPRQRVVAYLGQLDQPTRMGLRQAAGGGPSQRDLYDGTSPQWVEVDASRLRVERCREFGGPWLGLELMRRLGLTAFLERVLPSGMEWVPWATTVTIMILCRLLDPSSELRMSEHLYERFALEDLLGVSAERVNEDRLYRALDVVLPHKESLEVHLKERLGKLFGLDYDLLLYDVTSTYFEGQANRNPQAQRGHSRDHRGDCKQVCIGLVVSREGMPLGYELFAGNRNDVTTLEEIVLTMESRYGKAGRVWVLDRGMVSQENLEFLREGGRRYIVGTPKSLLRKYEKELIGQDWRVIRQDLEVKLCPSPDGQEVFILCRSGSRRKKEQAMHERFARRMEQGLLDLQASCIRQRQDPLVISERLGRLRARNSRASRLYRTEVLRASDGSAWVDWSRQDDWVDWAALSDGCYILRSNVTDWTDQELWEAYIQLTEAEEAFRIEKSDLRLRPVWHQKPDRVQAHVLVCFLSYALWKTFGQMCKEAGLGDEPRKVLDEIGQIRVIDVIVPTRCGVDLHKRCVTRPTDHQAILLHRLGFQLPSGLRLSGM